MNKQQQKLYDKRIKKINEHNLGPSEGKFDKLYITPLQAFLRIKEDSVMIWRRMPEDYDKIESALKALEIIKKKILYMDYFNVIADNCNLTYQEYELLRKVLGNENTN